MYYGIARCVCGHGGLCYVDVDRGHGQTYRSVASHGATFGDTELNIPLFPCISPLYSFFSIHPYINKKTMATPTVNVSAHTPSRQHSSHITGRPLVRPHRRYHIRHLPPVHITGQVRRGQGEYSCFSWWMGC